MEPFVTLTSVAAPLPYDNLSTDQILPILPASTLRPDYAKQLFSRMRRRSDGTLDPEFVLNRAPFRDARILVVGANFGCGGSREGAVRGLAASGIRCIVAHGFAEIFHENCLRNGVLPIMPAPDVMRPFEALVTKTDGAAPFTVDLRACRILCPDASTVPFEIDPAERTALLEGLDDISLTLKHAREIDDWERRTARSAPWLQVATSSQ